jgi:hypothetical protein
LKQQNENCQRETAFPLVLLFLSSSSSSEKPGDLTIFVLKKYKSAKEDTH